MTKTTRTWKDRLLRREPRPEPELHGFTQSALDERMFAAFKKGNDQRVEISSWANAASFGDDLQWSRLLTQEIEDARAAQELADGFNSSTLLSPEGLDALLTFTERYGRWHNLSAPIQFAAQRISDRLQHQDHPAPWEHSFPIPALPIHVEPPTATARRFSTHQEATGRSHDPLLEAQSTMRMLDLAQMREDLERHWEDQPDTNESIEPPINLTVITTGELSWVEPTGEEQAQHQNHSHDEDKQPDQDDDIEAGEHEAQIQPKPNQPTRSPKFDHPASSATGPLITPTHTPSASLNR